MKDFFKDIFEYHSKINQLLLTQMKENLSLVSERGILLMCHSVNAHQIWNARILSEKSIGVNDIGSIDTYINMDSENLRKTKFILLDRDLKQNISYYNTKGLHFENSIQHILFHISNHFSHHRGQLVSELKSNGLEPIVSDYIFHKRMLKKN